MDYIKVGRLICDLRKEKKMTQKQLADKMHISDKTISKWERGMGCPDVSLLADLSQILGVDIEKILSGGLDANDTDGGNMKRIKFYVCPECGNTLTSTGEGTISCCGRRVEPLKAQKTDSDHSVKVGLIDEEFYITFSHGMEKEHYLTFLAYVTCDKILMVKLYPEQASEVRMPRLRGGQFYYHCSQHGLWMVPGNIK